MRDFEHPQNVPSFNDYDYENLATDELRKFITEAVWVEVDQVPRACPEDDDDDDDDDDDFDDDDFDIRFDENVRIDDEVHVDSDVCFYNIGFVDNYVIIRMMMLMIILRISLRNIFHSTWVATTSCVEALTTAYSGFLLPFPSPLKIYIV